MAGYKTTIRTLNPALFMTFDGDAFDSSTRLLTSVPQTVLDESPNGNHGIMHNSSQSARGYRAGMPTMISLEQAYNQSMAFGYYGYQQTPSLYEKSFIEIPHKESMNLDRMKGYTLIMNIRKQRPAREDYERIGNNLLYQPVIRKNGLFTVDFYTSNANTNGSTTNYLHLNMKGTDINIDVNDSFITSRIGGGLYGRNFQLMVVWDPVSSETGANADIRIYIDGILVRTVGYAGFDLYPDLANNQPIEVAGLISSSVPFADRQISNLELDQIVLLKHALTSDEVGKLYKKTKGYQELVTSHNPQSFFECADINDPNTTALANTYGNTMNAFYKGFHPSDYIRYQTGPENVPGSRSVKLQNGAHVRVRRGTSNSGSFWPANASSAFSMDFYFITTATTQAAVFDQPAKAGGYWGMSLWVNRNNNTFLNGAMQLQANPKTVINIPGRWNDGLWHHCAIVQRASRLEIWLDGALVGSSNITPVDADGSDYTETMTFFNSPNGQTPGAGQLSNLAYYGYDLQSQQITMRSAYLKIYRVRGAVTLRGQPYRANVRFMSHKTGELIREIFSDSNTGEYVLDLVDGRLVDIVVLNAQDPTIRYRVYGPVTPSEFPDVPNG